LGCTLGCYGDERVHSPHIDAFAKESALFERAYCQIAVCTASRTSIMTGTRPETTGLFTLEHDWKAQLPDQMSIAGHFAEREPRQDF
jgi:iduronate 2-sulfatase